MGCGDKVLLKASSEQQRGLSAPLCGASASWLQSIREQGSVHTALDPMLMGNGALWFCLCCQQFQKAQGRAKVYSQISSSESVYKVLIEQPRIRISLFSSAFSVSKVAPSCLPSTRIALGQAIWLSAGPSTRSSVLPVPKLLMLLAAAATFRAV